MRHPFPMNLIIPADEVPPRRAREYLTGQLRTALLSGRVSPGDPLPSSRVLAEAVGVSRGTVVAVYEDLAGEGYVVIVPGSGTYVTEGLSLAEAVPNAERPSARPPADPEAQRPDGQINLLPGSPDASLSGNREWRAAWRSALKRELPGAPPDAAGNAELRELIAQHLRASRGVICAPEHVIVTAGTSDGIALVLRAQLSGGRAQLRVATENPGYPAARAVIEACGGTPVPLPVRGGGMDVAALRRAPGPFSAALLTPSHQYPLGGRLPVAARLELLAWAAEADAVICEDDYDSEFRHGSPLLPAIASLDRDGRVVLIGSYSKTLSPWLRCGYVVIQDPELRAHALRVREALGQPVSGLVQTALAEFMRAGGLQRHLARAGRAYAHRRGLVLDAAESLAPHLTLAAIEGGLHAAITWEGGPPADRVVAHLGERGVALAPLSKYYHAGAVPQRDGIVFGYGAPSDLQLRRGLDEIVAVLGGSSASQGLRDSGGTP